MKRSIIGFHLDEEDHWVANLDCGHNQHVRHQPPFVNRPWVVSEEGRNSILGKKLDCVRCNRMEWPEDCKAYRRTPEFDENTVPAGLTSNHATKRGIWGRIHVISGTLLYHVGPPVNESLRIDRDSSAVIVPEMPHRVELQGPARFYVEFSRAGETILAEKNENGKKSRKMQGK